MKKSNLLLLILVIVFFTGCGNLHIKDDEGRTLMRVYSDKTTDFIDWTHGAYVAEMHERDEVGKPTGRIAHDFQVKTQVPFWGRLFVGATTGAASAGIFAATGGMGCRNGRCGGGSSSTPMVINNDNRVGAQSVSGAELNSSNSMDSGITNNH